MKLSQILSLALVLALSSITPFVKAQVEANLVTSQTSVTAGQPFTVALHLVHQKHWHTYWLNPGTGLATSLNWTLPEGWKASEILWPTPHMIKDDHGAVTGTGYDDDLLLPVTITPAANAALGSTVSLSASAQWLMCKDVCKPGDATVSTSVTVSEKAVEDSNWGQKIITAVNELPQSSALWSLSAFKNNKTVVLTATASNQSPSDVKPSNLHFFSDDGSIAYDLPQVIGAGNTTEITLPISADIPASNHLVGVLTSDTSWLPGKNLHGLRVDIPISAARASTPVASAQSATSFGATLLLALLGGLILNLMPCVFPVLGIKILGFVNQAGSERKKVILHGLTFTLGVVLSFWVLVAILTILKTGGAQLGWGFQLQSAAFVFSLAAVMLVFALNLSGVFEFGLSATSVGGNLQMQSGFMGSFFTGILATMVATPCSAPFLAPALGAALTMSTVESFTVFTAVALGLSAPYLLLSIFPAAIRVLPKPGAWMETFKQFMAFPLYATVAYLVWVLAGQVNEAGLLSSLIGLVLVAMAVWIYGRYSQRKARVATVLTSLVLLGGLWTGWPLAAAASEIKWTPWSTQTIEQLRSEGRIVYVDFTARWCATCQANKKVVFHSNDVLKLFRDKNIATVRGDWTNRDPLISQELAKYSRSAVPFNLVWLPGKADPVLLPELLTPNIVIDAVNQK